MKELSLLMEAEFHSRHMVATLATVDADGGPRARMVIIRRLDERDDSIWITTNARSGKISQLERCARAELVCWAPNERQQFRVRGHVKIVREGALREEMWVGLSDPARGTFFRPTPGEVRRAGETFVKEVTSEVKAPETFVLLGLRATEVEALELNETPHRRRRWKESEGWRMEAINP